METKHLICIRCPLGCSLTATLENGQVTSVSGNTCPRGEAYARMELTAPMRTVTSTVRVTGASVPVISVKTAADIPKGKIFEVMDAIRSIRAKAPVHIGDVLLENAAGTGVAVVATKDAGKIGNPRKMGNTDKLGKNADALCRKKLFLLDMDGTIYNENRIFDGTLDFLSRIEQNGGRYLFLTNNSSKSVSDYVEKVNGMGIRADASHFFTSGQATAFYLKEHYPGQTVFCMGTRSLVDELRAGGTRVVTKPDDAATVVLIGFDTENTSEKVRDTCIMLNRDVAYLATNPDLVCPVSFGYIPDCGSMSIMLQNATGKTPFFIGKPEPIMIDCVLKKLGASKEETVIVGDRLYTDIAAGKNAGVDTVCVLSGEATLDDIQNGEHQPTWVFDSVTEICAALRR